MSTFKIKPYENLPSTGTTTYGAIFTFCVKSGVDLTTDLSTNHFLKYNSQDITQVASTTPTGYIYIDRGNNIPYKNNSSMNSVKQTVNRTKIQTGVSTYSTGVGLDSNGSGIGKGDTIFSSSGTPISAPILVTTSSIASNIKDISDVYQHLKYSNLTDTDAVAYFGRNVDGDTSILTNPSQLSSTILNTKLSGGGGQSGVAQPIDPRVSYSGNDRYDNISLTGMTCYSIILPPAATADSLTTLEFNDNSATNKLTDFSVAFTPLSLVIQSVAITSSAPTLTPEEHQNPPTPVTPGAGVEYTNNNSMTLFTTATQYIQYNVQRNPNATSGDDLSYKPGDTDSAITLPPTTTFTAATVGTPTAVSTFPSGPDDTNTVFTYVATENNTDTMTSGCFINCEPYDSTVQGDSIHNPGFTRAIQGDENELSYTTDTTSATKQIVNSYTVDGETRWYTPILPSASGDSVTVSIGGNNTTVYTLNPSKLVGSGTTIVLGDNEAATVNPCPSNLTIVPTGGGSTISYQVADEVGVYLDGQAGSIPNITSFTNSALVVQSANS